MEEDHDFEEEFNKLFNNVYITVSDEYTLKVLEDTYINIVPVFSKDG